jgi:hypothetical protein
MPGKMNAKSSTKLTNFQGPVNVWCGCGELRMWEGEGEGEGTALITVLQACKQLIDRRWTLSFGGYSSTEYSHRA